MCSVPAGDSHVGIKLGPCLQKLSVFIQTCHALRTKTFNGVRNSAIDLVKFWIKYRLYFTAVNSVDRSSCHKIS